MRPRLAPNTASVQQTKQTSQRRRSPAVPYELIRLTGERAVADGKATLASIKIATDSQSYFAQSLFIPCLRAEIVKPQRQKPSETQRAPSAVPDLRRRFRRPDVRYFRREQNIYAPAISRAILKFLAVAPAQDTGARPIRLWRFILPRSSRPTWCTAPTRYGSNLRRGEEAEGRLVQPRQRTRAATIDTMAAVLEAGQ
jgi:hypothetical protein